MNNIPVDVMRSLGVETVIVVDVEGKDDMGEGPAPPYRWGSSTYDQGKRGACMAFRLGAGR